MSTISELPIGAKLKFGAYSVAGEVPHKVCWIKAHGDGTLIAEYLEDQLAFDAKEPNNPDYYRREYGNNRYSVSNIHQFLNSTGQGWFSPQYEHDAAPTDEAIVAGKYGYDNKAGFLTSFEPWEIDTIEMSKIKTKLHKMDVPEESDEIFETIEAKVFLPSVANLQPTTNDDEKEGEYWELFEDVCYLPSFFSEETYKSIENEDSPYEQSNKWYYFLRTPSYFHSYMVRSVDPYGGFCSCGANDDYLGIRPALKLSPKAFISEDPDDNGYYEVLSTPQEIIEVDEQVFFAVLTAK